MAKEKRLIDANAIVVPKFDMKGRDLFNQGYCQGKTDGILEVKALAPTVDAVEVVHGRWKPDLHHSDGQPYRDEWYGHIFKCSVCGGTTMGDYDLVCRENYCPNCGAKMDGDGNE